MMLEVWNPIEEVMNYYRNVSDFPFNFRFLTTMNSNSNGRDAENAINGWVNNIPDDGWPNWVVRVQPFELFSTQAALPSYFAKRNVMEGRRPSVFNSGA